MLKNIVSTIVFLLSALSLSAQKKDTTSILNGLVIDEAVVSGKSDRRAIMMKLPQNIVSLDKAYIQSKFSGSLMQSLSGIPGVRAMSIGSGESKPSIRGLGFNRMVVTENGIKHEGQQWGEDHGLEIDQFDLDKIDIVKGPSALLYGSDAIGGVINLYSNYLPVDKIEAKANIFARSNNESIGVSAKVAGRNGAFYFRSHFTIIDYADYKIPADSIQYYSYYIKLKDRRLRNTAGREEDGSLTLGYISGNFQTDFRVSDIYSKSGFFANAHGLEVRMSEIDYDKSRRDIDLPFHSVNHLKIVNNTSFDLGEINLYSAISYQNNLRKECSEPVSHGYMPIPSNPLERQFNKNTFTVNLGAKSRIFTSHSISLGVNSEYQHNRRKGWGFIIPDFETFSIGSYLFDKYKVKNNLIISGGVRYDFINTEIHTYNDWFKTPEGVNMVYKRRSDELSRYFNSFTWSIGINYLTNNWVLKANIGKGFRAPIAKELGTDGINYHIFRYEKGNSHLNAEKSYQADAGISWSYGAFSFQIDPFVNYFPNYIYLNPTSKYTEGLQTYNYVQSEVFRWGLEAQGNIRIIKNMDCTIMGDYLYAVQLSGIKKDYTLPFSPPWSVSCELKYSIPSRKSNTYLSLIERVVGDKYDIVPPELPTAGYNTTDINIGNTLSINKLKLKMNLAINNIFNRKYYDHTSFYRLIDVPEPGRNVTVLLGIEF